MKHRRLGLILAGVLLLNSCSDTEGTDPTTDSTTPAEPVELTFRLWDEGAAEAYAESFDAFTEENPNITVTIDLVDPTDYWDSARGDFDSGSMADVFWVDRTNLSDLATNGHLVEIADSGNWSEILVELFTIEDELWAVPQMWNSTALYYNRDLYQDVDVSVSNLEWAPDGGDGDTLLDAALTLTTDMDGNTAGSDDFDASSIETYGFAADYELHSAFVPFLLQAGGSLQDSAGAFAFATEEGEQAAQHLVDLTQEHHVSPPAEDAYTDPNHNQDLFTSGNLVLYQSDSARLSDIAAQSDFSWGVAPLVGGPEGKVAVVDGIGVAGNANSDHPEETELLLNWLGTTGGMQPLADNGIGFPATTSGQDAYVNYWAKQGVDVSAFIESTLHGVPITTHDFDIHHAIMEMEPIIGRMLNGEIPVDEALRQAQEAGNSALDL